MDGTEVNKPEDIATSGSCGYVCGLDGNCRRNVYYRGDGGLASGSQENDQSCWQAVFDPISGRYYYWYKGTDYVQWTMPTTHQPPPPLDVPKPWVAVYHVPYNQYYYWNTVERYPQWKYPTDDDRSFWRSEQICNDWLNTGECRRDTCPFIHSFQ